ncbi:hypothetical protein Peur_049702 [Populus x canadensis]
MSGRGGKRAAAAREEGEGGADDNRRLRNLPSLTTPLIILMTSLFIGRNRRVTVRNWRGKINVDIREFYPKDGNLLPGKKGITLSLEQWNMLRDHVEEIDKALGHS